MRRNEPIFYVGWIIATLCSAAGVATHLRFRQVDRPQAEIKTARAAVGKPAPAVELSGEDGRLYDLKAFQGRRILLLFLCGCTPCEQVVTAVSTARLRDRKNTTIMGIMSTGPGDVRAFRQRTGCSIPLLLDVEGHVALAYRVAHCPTVWLLDERGYARATISSNDATARACIRFISQLFST